MSDIDKIFSDLEKYIYNSFKGILEPDKNWDKIFNLNSYLPKTSIKDTNNTIKVMIEIPNLTKDHQLKARLYEDYLVIEGGLEKEKTIAAKNGNRFSESRSEYIYKTIPLPVRVTKKGAKAIFKKGLLEITLNKAGELEEWNSDIEIDFK